MHEVSLIQGLLAKIHAIAGEHHAKKVVRVAVRLGALSHLSADHFREHFTQGARGTIAEAARLEIEESRDTADPHAQNVVLLDLDLAD